MRSGFHDLSIAFMFWGAGIFLFALVLTYTTVNYRMFRVKPSGRHIFFAVRAAIEAARRDILACLYFDRRARQRPASRAFQMTVDSLNRIESWLVEAGLAGA